MIGGAVSFSPAGGASVWRYGECLVPRARPCLIMHVLTASPLSPPLTAAGEGPHALPQTPECTDRTGLFKTTTGKTSEKNNQRSWIYFFLSIFRIRNGQITLFCAPFHTSLNVAVITKCFKSLKTFWSWSSLTALVNVKMLMRRRARIPTL